MIDQNSAANEQVTVIKMLNVIIIDNSRKIGLLKKTNGGLPFLGRWNRYVFSCSSYYKNPRHYI